MGLGSGRGWAWLGARLGIRLEHLAPRRVLGDARRLAARVHGGHVLGHLEALVLLEAPLLLQPREVDQPERRAVHARGALLVGAVADGRAHLDHGGLGALGLGGLDRLLQPRQVRVAVLHLEHLPAVRLVPLAHVLGERELGAAVDGDVVVVVEHDERAEAEVARERGGLARDPLLQAPVAADHEGVVLHHVEALAVEGRGGVRLPQRHAHGIGEALPQRAGGHLDAHGVLVLRVARRLRVHLAELLQVVDRQLVPGQMEHRVEQRARVAVGEDEAVPVGPLGVSRVVVHDVLPEHVRDRRAAHRRARVARVGLLHNVGAEHADVVDAPLLLEAHRQRLRFLRHQPRRHDAVLTLLRERRQRLIRRIPPRNVACGVRSGSAWLLCFQGSGLGRGAPKLKWRRASIDAGVVFC